MSYINKDFFTVKDDKSNSFDIEIRDYDLLDSTNDEAKRLIDEAISVSSKLSHSFILNTQIQTKGRGRGGNKWESEDGNLLATLLLSETIKNPDILPQISIYTSYIIGELIESLIDESSSSVDNEKANVIIKWPNDILVNQKKICGILPELHKGYLIIGFGLNNKTAPDINSKITATSLKEISIHKESSYLIREFLLLFFRTYQRFLNSEDFRADIYEKINSKLYKKDQQIEVSDSKRVIIEGINKGLDSSGNIILEIDNGSFRTFRSGEILFS